MDNSKSTLEVMVVPVGGEPYRKTLEADSNGSFLRGLQFSVPVYSLSSFSALRWAIFSLSSADSASFSRSQR